MKTTRHFLGLLVLITVSCFSNLCSAELPFSDSKSRIESLLTRATNITSALRSSGLSCDQKSEISNSGISTNGPSFSEAFGWVIGLAFQKENFELSIVDDRLFSLTIPENKPANIPPLDRDGLPVQVMEKAKGGDLVGLAEAKSRAEKAVEICFNISTLESFILETAGLRQTGNWVAYDFSWKSKRKENAVSYGFDRIRASVNPLNGMLYSIHRNRYKPTSPPKVTPEEARLTVTQCLSRKSGPIDIQSIALVPRYKRDGVAYPVWSVKVSQGRPGRGFGEIRDLVLVDATSGDIIGGACRPKEVDQG